MRGGERGGRERERERERDREREGGRGRETAEEKRSNLPLLHFLCLSGIHQDSHVFSGQET